MLKDEAELKIIVEKIVADMLAAKVAEKKFYTDERVGKEYWNLVTPGAFEKELVVIAALGYPEQAGVWSYTLLRQSRLSESSMEPYFRAFAERDIGLIAINPNCLSPDIEGDSFIYQLERVATDLGPDQRIVLMGFSMGGKIVVDFLQDRPGLLVRVAGLVLIDPTLSNRLEVGNIRQLLDNDTLLIASKGEDASPGEIASVLLGIPKVSLPGIHGEMPNKALAEILGFCGQRRT
ncbi:MAG: alpha/beta hydrolase [Planctomycetota bacterium]|jgi:pimeloyl-ACP methyl ester carboxylesterase